MAADALDDALKFVLLREDEFVDHPDVPGGRTNKSTTQKVYDRWRVRQGQPAFRLALRQLLGL